MAIALGDLTNVNILLAGLIDFYQAVERFEKYCSLCKACKNSEKKMWYSRDARGNLDIAYHTFLQNYELIFSIRSGVSLLLMSCKTTEDFKRAFEAQLNSLKKGDVNKYLACLNKIKDWCPSGDCAFKQVEKEVEEIKGLANELKKSVEELYTKDFLELRKRDLEEAIKNPDAFIRELQPKPSKVGYRM